MWSNGGSCGSAFSGWKAGWEAMPRAACAQGARPACVTSLTSCERTIVTEVLQEDLRSGAAGLLKRGRSGWFQPAAAPDGARAEPALEPRAHTAHCGCQGLQCLSSPLPALSTA